MLRIFLAAATAATLTVTAHAGERYPGEDRQERSWPERPRYTPSWQDRQRRYVPSYQYDLERRKVCGSYCDDVTRRRHDPFER